MNFMRFVAMEVRELMAHLGYREFYKMVGRSERLEMRRAVDHWKARTLDFSRILWKPTVPREVKRTQRIPQEHGLEEALDATTLIPLCRPALEHGTPVTATLPIRNGNRVVGTMLGSEVTRRWGAAGLPDDTIRLRFQGSAGQSFGAFVPHGMTLSLEGDANDYVGKGLSGGRIVVVPPSGATFVPEENVIIGNVAFYGATGGRGVHPGRGRRAVLRPQLGRHRRRRGDRRPRLRVHDRRARRRPRPGGPQLRGRDVGRRRVRPRRGGRLRDPLQHRARRSRPRGGRGRGGGAEGARPAARHRSRRARARRGC